MKNLILFIVCICCLSSGFSQNKSRINFEIKNLGIGVDGHFESIDIQTNFDTAGKLLYLKGKIKVASIKTGIESRDEHLLKPDYFDAKYHENITLVSKTITAKTDGVFNVLATLTIKDTSKDIRITVNSNTLGNPYKITSKFTINRTHFNIGGRSLLLSNSVNINVLHFHNIINDKTGF